MMGIKYNNIVMTNKYRETLLNLKDPANIGMLMGFVAGSTYYVINAQEFYIPGFLMMNIFSGLIGNTCDILIDTYYYFLIHFCLNKFIYIRFLQKAQNKLNI